MPQKRKGTRIFSEVKMLADQDSTMKHYRRIKAVRNVDEVRMLHQFFSPNIVPDGMTGEEVRQCLAIHPLRDWHRNRWSSQGNSLIGLALGRPLPREFAVCGRKITRAEFTLAMNKFKAEIAMLLNADIADYKILGDCNTGKTIAEQMVARFVTPLVVPSLSMKQWLEMVKDMPWYKKILAQVQPKRRKKKKV